MSLISLVYCGVKVFGGCVGIGPGSYMADGYSQVDGSMLAGENGSVNRVLLWR